MRQATSTRQIIVRQTLQGAVFSPKIEKISLLVMASRTMSYDNR